MEAKDRNFPDLSGQKAGIPSDLACKPTLGMRQPPIPTVAVAGRSCSSHTKGEFVREISTKIETKLGDGERHALDIQAYTEPGITGHGQGTFVVTIRGPEWTSPYVRFSIIFGVKGERRPFHREWYDDGDWSEAGDAQVAYVGSWDEAWLLICTLGERLGTHAVTLRYGA